MIKQRIRRVLHHFGYEINEIRGSTDVTLTANEKTTPTTEPPPVDPVWPLPRWPNGISDEELHKEFGKYDLWHYAYEFEGGISFSTRHNNSGPLTDAPERPLQRFRHFIPYLVAAQNGSLKGKRVLDIGCNSGFWSIQCALLGADVVGFDARPELIDQCNLIKSVIGIDNVDFMVLDFWNMSPRVLDGTFDIVLNLGLLYHLSNPLEVLRLTKMMTRTNILLDTAVYRSNDPVIKLKLEEASDIRFAHTAGIAAYPSRSAVDLILRHLEVLSWFEVPLRTSDMPRDYLAHKRASWLITV